MQGYYVNREHREEVDDEEEGEANRQRIGCNFARWHELDQLGLSINCRKGEEKTKRERERGHRTLFSRDISYMNVASNGAR